MNGFPLELAFLLLVGAVLLIRALYRRLREGTASMLEAQADPDNRPQRGAWAPGAEDAAARVAALPGPEAPAMARPMAGPPTRPIGRRAPRRARRFSRSALLPDRRAMQDAIVVAAILQPCHAQRARDAD